MAVSVVAKEVTPGGSARATPLSPPMGYAARNGGAPDADRRPGAGVDGTPAEGLEAASLDQAEDRALLAKAHLALGRMDVDVDGIRRQAQGQRADREESRCHQSTISLLHCESETPARYRAPVDREVQVLATPPQASGLADQARD